MFVYATEDSVPAADPFPWLQSLRQLGLQWYAHQMVQRSLYLPTWTPNGTLRAAPQERLISRSVLGIDLPVSVALRFTLRLVAVGEPYVLTMRDLEVGPDFRYWQAVSVFALDLIRRGQFVPAVRFNPQTARHFVETAAVWAAAFYEPSDFEWFERLASSMPAACRNFAERDGGSWYGYNAEKLLHNILDTCVDAFVRETFYGDADHELEDVSPNHKTAMQVMNPGRRRQFDQWYDALFAPQPVQTFATSRDVEQLESGIGKWIANQPASAPVRLGFRLEEPPETAATRATSTANPVPIETPDTRPGWQLTLFLQSAHDPSLMLPLADVASLPPSTRVFPETSTAMLHAILHSHWQVATDVCPSLLQYEEAADTFDVAPLRSGAAGAAPLCNAVLSVAQAYAFLRKGAPALQDAGFIVHVPSFWTASGRRRVRVQLQARTAESKTAQGPTRFGLSQWIHFDASVSLGDVRVSKSELERLAQAKAPLVQVRGQWTEVSPQALQEAIKFLESHNGKISIWELTEQVTSTRATAGSRGGELADGLEANTVDREDTKRNRDTSAISDTSTNSDTSDAKRGAATSDSGDAVDIEFQYQLPDELQAFVEGRWSPPALDVPSEFQGVLRPYQEKGFAWLTALTNLGVGACLADDMGLGKTIQLIALLCHMYDGQQADVLPEKRPSLILCPTSVLGNWQHELQRFAPHLQVLVHHGAGRADQSDFAQIARAHHIVLSTYALVLRDEDTLREVDWAMLAIDEAQHIKNSASKQARAVYRLADLNAGPVRRIALSGTPVENRLTELWSVFRFIAPGYLGSRERFRERFANPIERHHDKVKSTWLRSLIAPMVLRRVKTDVTIISDLPEKIEAKEYCALTKEQASLYKATVDNVIRQVEALGGMARRGLILASLTRLKQICDHPALFLRDGSRLEGRSGKLQRLTDLVHDIQAAGDATLVFTQYREMGELLVQHIARVFKREPLFLHGGVPKSERDKLVEQFQTPDGPNIFILSIRAGGLGLNLTRANHVIHFDRWWNPAVENQATDRAFRIGQTQTVEVHKFICQGTLEERIDQMMEDKRVLSEQIIGTGEGWITELETDELRNLFELRLGRSAVDVGSNSGGERR